MCLRFLARPAAALALLLPLAAVAQPRPAWTTSRLLGTPEAPPPYVAEPAFPGLEFDMPLDLVAGPDGRLYVLEHRGRIWSFDPQAASPAKTLFAHIGELYPDRPAFELYGLAFHPQFARNREVYVRVRLEEDSLDGSRILRARTLPGEPLRLDPASVETILTYRAGSHCGGNIAFGPDGFLYITTGDAGPASPPDIYDLGQTLNDLESAILRIDVDRRDPGLAYSIPRDNPFVGHPGARGEIWAYGLRNPWKIAFRPGTAELWAGDVGWERWEMIHRIERGGNYGWPITEGPQPVKPDAPRGPTPILPPVVVHPHTEAASITGGVFSTTARLPVLRDAYVYGDYMTGRIWALWHDGARVTRRQEVARTSANIVSFGSGHDGEVYFIDFGEKKGLLRLAPRPDEPAQAAPFPRRLSETGLFANAAGEQPEAGVFPYAVMAPLWQDGATARRWIALPGTEPAGLRVEQWGPKHLRRAAVPAGTVFVRTLSLDLIAGDPASRRRIETQLLQFDGRDWHAYAYRWNEAQTDAELVEAGGDATAFLVQDPAAPGGQRSLPWRFHARAECLKCHNEDAGRALGFMPGNLDLASLPSRGVVSDEFAAAAKIMTLVNPHDPSAPLDHRARSWLQANCAHCHRFQGGGSGAFRVNIETAAADTLLDSKPLQGDFGLPEARVVAPGAPERSTLYYRIAKSGPGRMPQLGSSTTDVAGLQLLWDWIAAKPFTPPTEPSVATLGDAMQAVQAVDRGVWPAEKADAVVAAGLAATDPQVRALFERFLPDDQRAATLGSAIDPHALLALRGRPEQGAAVATRAACLSCHRVGAEGRDFGPDLSKVGLRLSREQLLESLLEPAKTVDPAYQARAFELADGQAQVGFVVARTPDTVRLRVATGETLNLAVATIRSETPLPASLMPAGLLAELTAQEAIDLVDYLATLGTASR